MKAILRCTLLWAFVCTAFAAAHSHNRKMYSSNVDTQGEWEKIPQNKRSNELYNDQVSLLFSLNQRNLDKLEKKFWEVSDPNHADYGNYLSLDEMIALVAPPQKDSEIVTSWLSAQEGVHVVGLGASHDYVEVQMQLQAAESMLDTKFGAYRKSDRSSTLMVIDDTYSLPRRIGDLVEMVELKHLVDGQNMFEDHEEEEESNPEAHFESSRGLPIPPVTSQPIPIAFENFLLPNFSDPFDNTTTPIVAPSFIPVCLDGTFPTNNGTLVCPGSMVITGFKVTSSNLLGVPIASEFYQYSEIQCFSCRFDSFLCKATLLGMDSYYRGRFQQAYECQTPQQTTTTFVPYRTTIETQYTMAGFLPVFGPLPALSGILENTFLATPAVLHRLYGIPPSAKTTNPKNFQAVFASGGQFYNAEDLQLYDQIFNVPDATPLVSTNSFNDPARPGVPTMVNIELITSIAQGCRTQLESYRSKPNIFQKWLVHLLNARSPPLVVSVPYGDSELANNNFRQRTNTGNINLEYRTIFPGSSPYVTAVGATQLTTRFSPPGSGNVSEVVCSVLNGSTITSGGGFSRVFARPNYQDAASANYRTMLSAGDTSGYNINGRIVPDISILGHNYPFVIDGSVRLADSTGAASPVFAGMVTLWNDIRLNAKRPPLGFINPFLYSLPRSAFNDVTNGDNSCSLAMVCENGFPAAVGYDAATGLGTPKFDVIASFVAQTSN